MYPLIKISPGFSSRMVMWEDKDRNHASSENTEAADDPDKMCKKEKGVGDSSHSINLRFRDINDVC